MTDSPGPAPGAGLAARTPWRAAVWAAARAAASAAALLAIYYLLPLDRVTGGLAVTILVAGLVLLIGLVAFQVRSILGSRLPGLRAVEALATSVPLFLLLFAATYVVLATMSPGNFSQPLTRSDALYFTVTVFATVGFGDITAITQTARLIVTGQMIADFVVIGVAVRVIVSAAQRGRAATRERLATSREYHVQERYRYSMSPPRWA
jgi:voltage-gated potassium channel